MTKTKRSKLQRMHGARYRSPEVSAYVRKHFCYDESTGRIICKTPVWRDYNRHQVWAKGDVVHGWIDKCGYRMMRLPGTQVCQHIVAWFLKTGRWPDLEIDHRNGRPADNRWSNLRSATDTEQRFNSKKRSDNQSGHVGVSWDATNEQWCAQLNKGGQRIWLGRFEDKAGAITARADAEKLHFPHFERTER